MKSADDAFGNSVGNENIGLYQPFEVRGFSAVDAGNVRLDGLYFDRQTDLSTLLVPSSTMRVGISAQGYLLPAPTGIVDYRLARGGDQLRISPVVGYGPFDSLFVDLEAELPVIAEQFGIAVGLSYFEDAFEAGNDERGWSVAVAPRWRPSESIEIIPFYSRTTIEDNEAQPLVFVGRRVPAARSEARLFLRADLGGQRGRRGRTTVPWPTSASARTGRSRTATRSSHRRRVSCVSRSGSCAASVITRSTTRCAPAMVTQRTNAVGTNAVAYRGRWSELVEITLGLQKTRYEKESDGTGRTHAAARQG